MSLTAIRTVVVCELQVLSRSDFFAVLSMCQKTFRVNSQRNHRVKSTAPYLLSFFLHSVHSLSLCVTANKNLDTLHGIQCANLFFFFFFDFNYFSFTQNDEFLHRAKIVDVIHSLTHTQSTRFLPILIFVQIDYFHCFIIIIFFSLIFQMYHENVSIKYRYLFVVVFFISNLVSAT